MSLLPLRFWLYLGLISALAIGAWRIEQHGYQRAHELCALEANKANALAQEQRDKQAATAQAASADYEKQAAITETKLKAARHEIYVATQNLATCHLSGESVRLLNDAGDYGNEKP